MQLSTGQQAAYNEIYDGKVGHDNYMYTLFTVSLWPKELLAKGGSDLPSRFNRRGKRPDFRCDTHPDNLVMQHLLEKIGLPLLWKVPIDGVRLAYQKIKRKAETSLFQVVSEEDRWDQRKSRSSLQ